MRGAFTEETTFVVFTICGSVADDCRHALASGCHPKLDFTLAIFLAMSHTKRHYVSPASFEQLKTGSVYDRWIRRQVADNGGRQEGLDSSRYDI